MRIGFVLVLLILASGFTPAQAAIAPSQPASNTPWGTLVDERPDSEGTNPGTPIDDDAEDDDDGQDDVLPPTVREAPPRALHSVISYPRLEIVCASQCIGSSLFRPPCL